MAVDQELDPQIRTVFDQLEEAWNLGDARLFGAWFRDDAAYIGRAGRLVSGRDAIAELLQLD